MAPGSLQGQGKSPGHHELDWWHLGGQAEVKVDSLPSELEQGTSNSPKILACSSKSDTKSLLWLGFVCLFVSFYFLRHCCCNSWRLWGKLGAGFIRLRGGAAPEEIAGPAT